MLNVKLKGDEKNLILDGVLDTGATNEVVGERTLEEMQMKQEEKFLSRTTKRKYLFGNGEVLQSSRAVRIPIWLFGRRYFTWTDVLEGVCTPFLISNKFIKEHGIMLFLKGMKAYNENLTREMELVEKQGLITIDLWNSDGARNGEKGASKVFSSIRVEAISDDEDEEGEESSEEANGETTGVDDALANEENKKSSKVELAISETAKFLIATMAREMGWAGEKKLLQALRRRKFFGAKPVLHPALNAFARLYARATTFELDRKPFPKMSSSTRCANKAGDWGAMDNFFYEKEWYSIYMDLYTRRTRVWKLQGEPSGAKMAVFVKEMRGMGKLPAKLLTDRGPEFLNHEFERLLDELGVEHHLVAGQAHFVNGVVERRVKTIKTIAARFKRYTTLKSSDRVMASMNAVNDMPMCVHDGKSPTEMENEVHGPPEPSVDETAKIKRDSPECEAQEIARQLRLDKKFVKEMQQIYPEHLVDAKDFRILDLVEVYNENTKLWEGPHKIVGVDEQDFIIKQGPSFIVRTRCQLRKAPSTKDFEMPGNLIPSEIWKQSKEEEKGILRGAQDNALKEVLTGDSGETALSLEDKGLKMLVASGINLLTRAKTGTQKTKGVSDYSCGCG